MGKEESAENRGVVMGLALNDFTAACHYERKATRPKGTCSEHEGRKF